MKLPYLLIVSCLLLSTALGSPAPTTPTDQPVVIGSANFAESELLAEIFAQALEEGGVKVERRFDLGSREEYLEALRRGEIDLVPEYLGSALRYLSDDAAAGDAKASKTYRALQKTLQGTELQALTYARAEDTNVVVVTGALAKQENLSTISDLKNVSDDLTFGGSAECMQRVACYRGLTDVYGLKFERVETLDTAGPDTVAALADGKVDVTFLFSTQGVITDQGFVILADDQGAQPAENIVPVIRRDSAETLGSRLTDPLSAVTKRLTTEELRALNTQLGQGDALEEVARVWLGEQTKN